MDKITQKLFKAIRQGRLEKVKDLLAQGVHMETRLPNGYTPLLHAIRYKQKDIVIFLLECSAHIEARENREYTALLLAVEKNMLSMVQLLLEHGADANARKYCYDGHDECDPRHWSDSALIIAAKNNNYPIVKLLLEHGADVNVCEECEGGTALRYASQPQIAQMLIDSGADVNARAGEHGYTSLMWAAACHHYAQTKVLLANGADMNLFAGIDGTAAHIAAEFGCVAIVKLLLEAGFDANFIAPQSMSLLWHGRYILSEKDGDSFLRLLIKHGYDINMKYRGKTDLMRLAPYKYAKVLKLLIQHGADIHIQDDEGKTILDYIPQSNKNIYAYVQKKMALEHV